MNAYTRNCCTSDCREVNGCQGYAICEKCGKRFCGCELRDGKCEFCRWKDDHTCAECGNVIDEGEELDDEGLCGVCAAAHERTWAMTSGGMVMRAVLIGLSLVSFCCQGAINYDRLLDAVEMVESDRGATSWNTYQVRQIWLEDCKRIGLIGTDATIREIARDRSLMRRLVLGYWGFYGSQYRRTTGKPVTAEVLARIHNGGPTGWKKKATASYWRRVRKHYNKGGNN